MRLCSLQCFKGLKTFQFTGHPSTKSMILTRTLRLTIGPSWSSRNRHSTDNRPFAQLLSSDKLHIKTGEVKPGRTSFFTYETFYMNKEEVEACNKYIATSFSAIGMGFTWSHWFQNLDLFLKIHEPSSLSFHLVEDGSRGVLNVK